MVDFRLGRYQDVLADVGEVSAVIADPPYGARTHAGHNGLDYDNLPIDYQKSDGTTRPSPVARASLSYQHWTPDDVRAFIAFWAPRCRGWFACMTSHDLIPVWEQAYTDAKRYAFAPVGIVQDRVRLGGDGPASALVYLMVSRPKTREFSTWGALPGYYKAGIDREGHIGGKPIGLMSRIVSDYSRPGDTVCDPCAGGATTLVAARQLGRSAIGAECDATTYAKAKARLDRAYVPDMFAAPEARARQVDFVDDLPW